MSFISENGDCSDDEFGKRTDLIEKYKNTEPQKIGF